MRKLIFLAVISAIISLYFVVDAEYYLTFQNKKQTGEVIPLGTDIIGLYAKRLPEITKKLTGGDQNLIGSVLNKLQVVPEEFQPGSLSKNTSELISQTINLAQKAIQKPIEQKINETFCSPK